MANLPTHRIGVVRPHTRRNFEETTARRLLFELTELQMDLRTAKVEVELYSAKY
jgi:hypothetical protein